MAATGVLDLTFIAAATDMHEANTAPEKKIELCSFGNNGRSHADAEGICGISKGPRPQRRSSKTSRGNSPSGAAAAPVFWTVG